MVYYNHHMPMLLLHGELDDVVTMEYLDPFRRFNPDSRLVVIPGAFLLLLRLMGAPEEVCLMTVLAYSCPCGMKSPTDYSTPVFFRKRANTTKTARISCACSPFAGIV